MSNILFSSHPTLLGHVPSDSFEVNMGDFTMPSFQAVHDIHSPLGDQVVWVCFVNPPPSSAEAFIHLSTEQAVDQYARGNENFEPPTIDIR
jgi:hypothetical protein